MSHIKYVDAINKLQSVRAEIVSIMINIDNVGNEYIWKKQGEYVTLKYNNNLRLCAFYLMNALNTLKSIKKDIDNAINSLNKYIQSGG